MGGAGLQVLQVQSGRPGPRLESHSEGVRRDLAQVGSGPGQWHHLVLHSKGRECVGVWLQYPPTEGAIWAGEFVQHHLQQFVSPPWQKPATRTKYRGETRENSSENCL